MIQSRVFISYSHKDKEWLQRLQAQLGVLRQEGLVAPWSDENLEPGDDWPHEIRAALDGSDIAVLLISANFLSSKFIMEKEMPVLLERRQAGTLRRILPLVVTPCAWQLDQNLKSIEVRPKGRSVAQGNQAEQDADLADVTTEIAKVLVEPARRGEHRQGLSIAEAREQARETPLSLRSSGYVILEVRLGHREWDRYTVELSLTESGTSEAPRALRHCASFDLPMLLGLGDPVERSRRLRDLLFPEPPQQDLVRKAEQCARRLGIPLRLRIVVDAGARELHCLPWELLTYAEGTENPLSSESTYLVRYAAADPYSWRYVQRRPKAPLRAILAAGLTDWFGSSIPPAGAADPALEDRDRAAEILTVCGVESADVVGYLNAEALRAALREKAADILYVCVDLPPESGPPDAPSDSLGRYLSGLRDLPLADALRALESPPRLVILRPIVRGDRAAASGWISIVREAHELAQAGVTGILTAQGPLDAATWRTFLQTFFQTLGGDGRMDLAMQAARTAIGDPGQQWKPVLISGVRTARIWYEPRFTGERTSEPAWETLLSKIRKGLCTPILGPGLSTTIAQARSEIALSWADSFHYPMAFHERISLPQVGQYVASVYGQDFFYEQYEERLRDFALRRYGHLLSTEERKLDIDRLLSKVAQITLATDPDEPHNILAALPFHLYVTASQNSFLSDALRGAPGKQPQEAVLGLAESTGPGPVTVEPSPNQPLVYHLFGRLSDLRGSVITEDNYFDFLIHLWKEREAVPKVIRAALTSSSLLFLGFKMDQWDFRVLFRSLLAQEGARRRTKFMHVAVQVDPDDDHVTDPERARDYIENYFSKFADAEINVFWGSAEDFLRELKKRWNSCAG